MHEQKAEAKVCAKEAMLEQLKVDGHLPSDFTFYYVTKMSPDGELEACKFEELPEDLDSFCCQARAGWPLYNYNRTQDPKIVRIEKPEEDA
jgi:hypothetical protein